MATCDICARKTCDVPLPRDPNVKYSAGDVYSLKESVYSAIYDIFRKTFGEGSGARIRSCKSLNKLTGNADVIRDGRPAIIMKDGNDDPKGVWVCLATTYSGEDISELPRIFRHFSIPIAPNNHMLHGYLNHLHGLPEWDRDNAWLIAWSFQSTATCEGKWTTKADAEEVPQALGTDAMEFLLAECERKEEEWWEMCDDPKVAAELEAELRDHVQKRFYNGAGRKTASLESVATGINAPSWRRPMTIPEDSDNDFTLVTSGKPRKPMPWKGKHHTGSTWSFASASTKKGDADKKSIKSKQSRTSLVQDGLMNRFDILRAVRVK